MEKKMLTVRLSEDQAADLAAVADVDGVPVAEEVREAIRAHIETRRRDKEFQERRRASIERNRAILEKLADS